MKAKPAEDTSNYPPHPEKQYPVREYENVAKLKINLEIGDWICNLCTSPNHDARSSNCAICGAMQISTASSQPANAGHAATVATSTSATNPFASDMHGATGDATTNTTTSASSPSASPSSNAAAAAVAAVAPSSNGASSILPAIPTTDQQGTSGAADILPNVFGAPPPAGPSNPFAADMKAAAATAAAAAPAPAEAPTLPGWFWPHYENRTAAESQLFNQPTGAFLVRVKKSKPRGYCLSLVGPGPNGQTVEHAQKANMAHCEIVLRSDTKLSMPALITDGREPKAFGSIKELVAYHTVTPLDYFGIVLKTPIEREDAAAGGSYTKEGNFVRVIHKVLTPLTNDSVEYAILAQPGSTSAPASTSAASPSALASHANAEEVQYAILQPPTSTNTETNAEEVQYAVLQPPKASTST